MDTAKLKIKDALPYCQIQQRISACKANNLRVQPAQRFYEGRKLVGLALTQHNSLLIIGCGHDPVFCFLVQAIIDRVVYETPMFVLQDKDIDFGLGSHIELRIHFPYHSVKFDLKSIHVMSNVSNSKQLATISKRLESAIRFRNCEQLFA